MKTIRQEPELVSRLALEIASLPAAVNYRANIIVEFNGILTALEAGTNWRFNGTQTDHHWALHSTLQEVHTNPALISSVMQITHSAEAARVRLARQTLQIPPILGRDIIAWCLLFPERSDRGAFNNREWDRLQGWLTTETRIGNRLAYRTASTSRFEARFGVRVEIAAPLNN